MKLENSFSVAAISDLAKGCLADSPAGSTVRFGLAAEERVALRLFLKGRSRLAGEPCGVALGQTDDSNCRNCHNQMRCLV